MFNAMGLQTKPPAGFRIHTASAAFDNFVADMPHRV